MNRYLDAIKREKPLQVLIGVVTVYILFGIAYTLIVTGYLL